MQSSNSNKQTDSAGQEIECPWCQSLDVVMRSPYGGSAAEVLMQCSNCKTPFGWMKWHAKVKTPTQTN